MTMIPHQRSNSYYTSDGLNTIYLNTLNPLGVMANFVVTIEAPTFPSIDPEIEEEPTYSLGDFLIWAPMLEEYLRDKEDSAFFNYFMAMSAIAKTRVRWSVIQEKHIWKRLISYYIAHHMEVFINQLKDEANRMSLHGYDKEKDYKLEFEVGNEVYDELKTTTWGRIFWQEWQPYGRFQIFGLNY